MFINSVKLYNTRILNIYNEYKNILNYKGKRKAIIVLICYVEIRKFIKSNYIFLKQNYHDKLIFYVTENKTLQEEYLNIKYNIIDISNVFFKFPHKFNESAYTPNFKKRGKWNYQHMCRFFFRDIFLHPSLFDVEMYMRLDSDSILNTTINLFLFMGNNIVYMYNKVLNDASYVVEGLKEYTTSFIRTLKIEAKDKERYKNAFKQTVLIYYNNFEICRMKFFRSIEMIKFTNLVDLSYGQFIYRWGDAPLRYISLSLYANNKSLIPIPKIIRYCHRGCS